VSRTPEQQQAVVAVSKYLCVDAGAGSGKTRVLVERIVHLLETRAARLEEIVAITFTEKAAAEMKMRLRRAFHEKAPAYDPEAMSFWRDLERRVETARVSTIHSFCAALLRENAIRIGLDPDFAILADAEGKLFRSDTVSEALHGLIEAGNAAARRAAVEFRMVGLARQIERCLDHAAVMADIVVEHPVTNPEALQQHWAQLARADYEDRLSTLASAPSIRWFRNRLAEFDGQCRKPADPREILRREMLASLDAILVGAGVDEIETHLERILDLSTRGTRSDHWDSPADAEALKKVEERFKDFCKEHRPLIMDGDIERAAAEVTCAFYATYAEVASVFAKAKAARTSMDFDDLIAGALDMLREREDVRRRVAGGIKHLLIDEFQDTNSPQLEIAQWLAREEEGPNLFIVGDAKQSIYDFRGAEVELFQQEKDCAEALITLDRNFRSVPEVMAFVNDFFAASDMLAAVEGNYHPLRAHRPASNAPRIEFLIPEVDEGRNAEAYRKREAALIADRISAFCDAAGPVRVQDPVSGEDRPPAFGDVALLFRAMGDVHLYEEALRRSGIPYQIEAGQGFYERQEVIDLRNLLGVVLDAWDETALAGFLRGPIAGLSDDGLVRLCAHGGLVGAFESDGAPEGLDDVQVHRLERARALVADLRAHVDQSVPAFLRYMLAATGFEAILLSQFLGVQKAANVRKTLDLAEDFSRTRPPSLGAFARYLEEMARYPDVREGESAAAIQGQGAVTLMTIHKAKGLEFPVVFVPDCSRGRGSEHDGPVVFDRRLGLAARVTSRAGASASPVVFDAITRAKKARDEAEHARVLYVAMTRARDWLFLSGAPETQRKQGASWLDALDACYGVVGMADGERVSGAGWEAVVRRRPATARVASYDRTGASAADTAPDLARQVSPVRTAAIARPTVAVTRLLDATGFAEDRDEATGPKRLVDPLTRGTLVHALFERWSPTVDVAALAAALATRECPGADESEVFAADIEAVAARFADSAVATRLTQDAGAMREAPFLLRLGNYLVSGTIDVLFSDGTIIDYKTGLRHAEREARYEAQLCLYAAAVRALLKRDVPEACLYYADTGALCRVDVTEAKTAAILHRAETMLEKNHGRS